LPLLPCEAFAAACDAFDRIAEAAGLVRVVTKGPRGAESWMRFELEDDTTIDTADFGEMPLTELEDHIRSIRRVRSTWDVRCSGSFHDPTRVRTDSHLVNWGRYGIGIWDSMTAVTWHRRSKATVAETLDRIERLRTRNPFAGMTPAGRRPSRGL
jgi:hypothetical protein